MIGMRDGLSWAGRNSYDDKELAKVMMVPLKEL